MSRPLHVPSAYAERSHRCCRSASRRAPTDAMRSDTPGYQAWKRSGYRAAYSRRIAHASSGRRMPVLVANEK
jgi:hypothetical protein